jgi:predicted DNA-binding protein
MKDHRITVRFSPELRRRLKAAARRGGARESDLVRDAVERQLAAEERSPTAYELAKKAGLIGAVKGTIRDLSTNPKIPARSWPYCWNPMHNTKRVLGNFVTSGVRC